MRDTFFESRCCDRCGSESAKRISTMSWFTEEKICMECSAKESEIKKALRAKGDKGAMEGCGYVPKVEAITPAPH